MLHKVIYPSDFLSCTTKYAFILYFIKYIWATNLYFMNTVYQINKGLSVIPNSSKPEINTMIIYQLTHTEPRFDHV